MQVYIKSGCPYCKKLIKELDRDSIDYELINLSHYPEMRRKLRELGAVQVPAVVKNGCLKSSGYQGLG